LKGETPLKKSRKIIWTFSYSGANVSWWIQRYSGELHWRVISLC
jgi:hypothetical protein